MLGERDGISSRRAACFRVGGRVQGVGFRFFVLEAAESLGLAGWVRNLPGGDVEAVAEGAADAIETFAAALRCGPRSARVERFDRRDVSPSGTHRGFEVRG